MKDKAKEKLINGYKVTEVVFSKNETCSTFMMANINPKFDIDYNLLGMKNIAKIDSK